MVDNLLSLDMVRRYLGLPLIDISDLVGTPRKALLPLKSCWWMGNKRWEWKKGKEEKLRLAHVTVNVLHPALLPGWFLSTHQAHKLVPKTPHKIITLRLIISSYLLVNDLVIKLTHFCWSVYCHEVMAYRYSMILLWQLHCI